jgi:hypothetical protein
MLNKIIGLVRNEKSTQKREDISTLLTNTLAAIDSDIIPMMEQQLQFHKDNKTDIDDIKSYTLLNNMSGRKYKDVNGLLNYILNMFNDVSKNKDKLTKLVNDLPNIITKEELTVRDSSVIIVVDDLSSAVMFTSDLLYIGILDLGGLDTAYPKKKIADIESGIASYSTIIDNYGNGGFSKVIKDIESASNVKVDTNFDNESIFSVIVGKSGGSPTLPVHGFIGNPIYHIRRWLVDLEIRKYNNLKEKKRLTELKLLSLKSKRDGNVNNALEKQIEYYEDKIIRVEREIARIEEE